MQFRLINDDALNALKNMEDKSINCCITSPPYWHLRDYKVDGQIGLEETPSEYIHKLASIFNEVKRILKDDGTLWINIADTYAANRTLSKHRDAKNSCLDFGLSRKSKVLEGLKPKDLIGIPWRLAFALQDNGWYLRQDIIWNKSNAMPEPVKDRCTKSHEYIFLFSKSPKYYFDSKAIQENATTSGKANSFARKTKYSNGEHGQTAQHRDNRKDIEYGGKRNKRSVWTLPTKPFKGAHFATFPPDLVRPCILAGSPVNGTILDPFAGAGTTGLVALEENRYSISIELNPEYAAIAQKRLENHR